MNPAILSMKDFSVTDSGRSVIPAWRPERLCGESADISVTVVE